MDVDIMKDVKREHIERDEDGVPLSERNLLDELYKMVAIIYSDFLIKEMNKEKKK